jgi:hypothetical protein
MPKADSHVNTIKKRGEGGVLNLSALLKEAGK